MMENVEPYEISSHEDIMITTKLVNDGGNGHEL